MAVIESKIRWRSRDRIAIAATLATPNTAPATTAAKNTVEEAPAAALDDAGQPADVGAVDHGHESAHARDQECDDAAGHRRGDQHTQPVPVGEQAHRHGAQQRHTGREGDDNGNDRGGRAQRRHHGGLCQLDGVERTGPSSDAYGLGRGHFTILPGAT